MIRTYIIFFGFALLASGQNTGTIIGAVRSSNNVPIGGAFVSAYSQVPGSAGQIAPVFNSISEVDGSFNMAGLPPGKYLLCAEKASAMLLNPCLWSATQNVVAVSAGSSSVAALTAEIGVSVLIRINDPSGLFMSDPNLDDLLINAKTTSGPNVLAVIGSKDLGGKTMTMLLPGNQRINLKVYSAKLALTDNQGDSFGGANSSVTLATPLGAGISAEIASITPAALTITIGKKN